MPVLIESSAAVQLPKEDGPQLLSSCAATSVQTENWTQVKNGLERGTGHS